LSLTTAQLRMKKCTICGTVSSEQDQVCGVCGTSLDEVEAKSEIGPSTVHPSTVQAQSQVEARHVDRRTQGIFGLLIGIGMVATGILIIRLIALFGILMLLFGFTVIATDISWMRGNTFYDQDQPVLHGRAPLHGHLSYGPGVEEEKKDSPSPLSQEKDDEK
jgi:hypothetical protein